MSKGCLQCLMHAARTAETQAASIRDKQVCCAEALMQHAKTVRAMADQEHTPTVPTVVYCKNCGHAEAVD